MEVGLEQARRYELIASVGRKESCGVQSRVEIRGILSSQSSIRTFSQRKTGLSSTHPMAIYISAKIFHL